MNKTPLNKGLISENFSGIGPVTRAMVHMRTKELALIAGRIPPQVGQADYEQAQRELGGEPGIDPLEELVESFPESNRWDPVRSESEQLAEEGVAEAEHDQMLQAAKAAAKAD
jgi:hypothetical protein